ncbi:MAG TPA: hypothetical protein PK954_08240 [Anaerolineales bacterium]|nr:hypothetical protein [Anaerolineales bacterium]HRF50354.1 hypothetical protein [Anaerolineales bacterium]
MADQALHKLNLGSVADRCAEESRRFFGRQSYDARFCFELFRRAFAGRDSRAWDLVYAQYHALVKGWVVRHPSFASLGEEPAYYINRAFERMFTAVTPEKFGKFDDLRQVLRYLQMCTGSVIIDAVRRLETAEQVALDEAEHISHPEAESVEGAVLADSSRVRFWQWLEGRLKDDLERAVMHGCFVLDMKPRELAAARGAAFGSVAEVYRIKQNVLERLRRDPEVREYLEALG